MAKKYKIPVVIQTTVSETIGEVEVESLEEFEEKAEELWKEKGYDTPTFCHQCSIDTGDWEVSMESAKLDFEMSKKEK